MTNNYDTKYSEILIRLSKQGVLNDASKSEKMLSYINEVKDAYLANLDPEKFLAFYDFVRYTGDSSLPLFHDFLFERYKDTESFNKEDPIQFEAALLRIDVSVNVFERDYRSNRFDPLTLDLNSKQDLAILDSMRKLMYRLTIPQTATRALEDISEEISSDEMKNQTIIQELQESLDKFQNYITRIVIEDIAPEGARKIEAMKLSQAEMLILKIVYQNQFEMAWKNVRNIDFR